MAIILAILARPISKQHSRNEKKIRYMQMNEVATVGSDKRVRTVAMRINVDSTKYRIRRTRRILRMAAILLSRSALISWAIWGSSSTFCSSPTPSIPASFDSSFNQDIGRVGVVIIDRLSKMYCVVYLCMGKRRRNPVRLIFDRRCRPSTKWRDFFSDRLRCFWRETKRPKFLEFRNNEERLFRPSTAVDRRPMKRDGPAADCCCYTKNEKMLLFHTETAAHSSPVKVFCCRNLHLPPHRAPVAAQMGK